MEKFSVGASFAGLITALLFVVGLGSAVWGYAAFSHADNVMQQIVAMLALVISAVSLGATAIVMTLDKRQ